MGKRSDWQDLERTAVEQGWTVGKTNGGHLKFAPPPGTGGPVFVSFTPGDFRSIRNTRAMLKRRGLKL